MTTLNFTSQNQSYNGNPHLLKTNVVKEFTAWEKEEFIKCMKDPAYFCKTYIKIVHVDHGLVPFKMYEYQERMIDAFNTRRFVIARCPRQSGKTTAVISFLLHQALFNEKWTIGILANKGDTARDILSRLQLSYENLPNFLKQGILTWNKGSLEFENGSRIKAAPTSAASVRGGVYNIIFLDEFAFIPENIAEKFFSATYPVISSGKTTKVFIVSTPHGMNKYYELWQAALAKENDYFPIDVHWWDQPGRDEAWKLETIRNTSEEQFRQEFEVEFIGSTNTLLSARILQKLTNSFVKPIYIEDDAFRVFNHPEPKHTYVITVDVSRGQSRDYSAFSVIDVTNIPYVQVATYQDNQVKAMVFPTIIYSVAMKYNDAWILVEINDIGAQVADILHYDLAYERLLKVQQQNKQGQHISGGYKKKLQFGLKQSVATKKVGCANIKALVESEKLVVQDRLTIQEFLSFSENKDSFAAEEGKHDDLVMTLVIFGWLSIERYFRESIQSNVRSVLQEEDLELTDWDLLPLPVLDDHFESGKESFRDRDGNFWKEVESNKWTKSLVDRYPFDRPSSFPGGDGWDWRLGA